jgi:opacity protein-like surface antigen
MRHVGPALLLGLLPVLPVVAEADERGVYLALRGGPNFLPEQDDGIGLVGSARLELDYNPGFNISGAIGYRFPPMALGTFRIEAEAGYQQNDLKDASLTDVRLPGFIDVDIVSTSGAGKLTTLMANVYFDFDFGWVVQPFVGAGLGVAWASLDDVGGTVEATLPIIGTVRGSGSISDDTDALLAGQAVVGLGLPLTDHIVAGLSYRAFVTSEADLEVRLPIVGPVEEFESEVLSHGAQLELRYVF